MMQNLPFLVAKTNPVKNQMMAKQPNDQADKPEGSKSFKQVLSKQVEQDESKKAVEQSTSSHGKNKDDKNASSVSGNINAEEILVDAQLIASTVTAKAINEVTDGEVVLEVPKSDVAQAADTMPILMTNMTPVTQPINQAESSEIVAKTLAVDVSTQTKLVDGRTATKEGGTGLINAPAETTASLVQADQGTNNKLANYVASEKTPQTETTIDTTASLVQADQGVNNKLANYLVGEKTRQSDQELSVSQSISSMIDASSLTTMPLQAAAKPLSQPMPTIEQAGFNPLINVAPGKPGWSEAIGQKVVWMVGAGEQSATLTLNPKDLGPLQVIIHVNNEKADATFISENPEVRKALEEGMSGLRQSMGQAGVELGQANVNTSKQHQEFQQASKEYAARQRDDNGTSSGADQLHNTPVSTRVSHGLVDTFV